MIMHIPRIYYFIDDLNENHITKLKKNVAIIYRNYSQKADINKIIKFNKICKKNKRLFFISNNIKLAIKLDLNGSRSVGILLRKKERPHQPEHSPWLDDVSSSSSSSRLAQSLHSRFQLSGSLWVPLSATNLTLANVLLEDLLAVRTAEVRK